MAKWLPPHGFTGKVHQIDARVGGTYKMSFTNFSSGSSHSFGGKYLELKPGELISTPTCSTIPTSRRDDDHDHAEEVFCGTDLDVVQEGIPAVIPVEACYLGWQESLVLLAQLVEAEIPG
jgi:uncharacterized protein YndB with AHSA1/START domain